MIAGHGRVLAATQMGLTEAPVIVLGHPSEAQRRAYQIADGKHSDFGSLAEPGQSSAGEGLVKRRPKAAR